LWANQEIRINMTKNTTRKGLAFGAGFALVASGIAGIPAQAAGMDNGFISLAPNAGAEYDVLAGSDFQLKSDIAAGIVGSAGTLKFQISDGSGRDYDTDDKQRRRYNRR
jgi:hypothetical protein